MNLAITGATSGIGEQALNALLKDFDQIFILARNKEKGKKVIEAFLPKDQEKCLFVQIDLADMNSVAQAADVIRSKTDQLDVLINNAGGIFKEKEITKDGFEMSLSANHLGHFLLTMKLMPLLLNSNIGKVINVSSEAHKAAKVDFNDLNYINKGFSSFGSYANVKLFNILFTKSLVDKFGMKGLQAYALHPGVVKTNFAKESAGVFSILWKIASPFMITAEQGAKTTVYLAKTNIDTKLNGSYFKKSKPTNISKAANSKNMREKLWTKSEEMLSKWL